MPGRCARLAPLAVAYALGSACGIGGSDDGARPSSEAQRSPQPQVTQPLRVAVRTTVLPLVDDRRVVRRRTGVTEARRLPTVVRYPVFTGGTAEERERKRPLIVFGHGYALSPRSYVVLLDAWARAGYVVAAPAFPGERADAPGGPDRTDLLNQPADMRFVIDALLRRSRRGRGVLAGVIDPARIAVGGHSDGGNTALAVAFDPRFRHPRVDAALILAGADLPGVAPFAFAADGRALLAVQGSADSINPPADTQRFFVRARRPKVLLTLPGGGHFAPYMRRGQRLRAVQRVTTAFLDQALDIRPVEDTELRRRAGAARIAQLSILR